MNWKKRILIFLPLIVLMISFSSRAEVNHRWNLLDGYVDDPSEFKEFEIGKKIVYYHQRMIGEAIVELDFILFHFDRETHELIDAKMNWREDLVPVLAKLNVTQAEAESMVEGEPKFSRLYIISPESFVFSSVKPTPENPCWVVTTVDDKRGMLLSVIDAVEGTILGYGAPPPHTAFSLCGPSSPNPCDVHAAWLDLYLGAREWFEIMGYDTWWLQWPTQEQVRSHIESDTIAMFYEIAHGDWDYFKSGCVGGFYEYTWAWEIEDWIADYTKMPFTFLASCGAMCQTDDGTLSFEFRKGSNNNTATVGYCDMDSPECDACWLVADQWQDALFGYMNDRHTVKEAFDLADDHFPACFENTCMRFAGDESLRAVQPRISRNCFPDCHGDYEKWLSVGRPECWCYPRQCHGDADGQKEGSDKAGYSYVATNDLNILIAGWQVKEPPFGPGIASIPNGICADFAHDQQGSSKTGLMRVSTNDLNILVANWLVKEPPQGPGVPPDCLNCGRGFQSGNRVVGTEELAKWVEDVWLDPEMGKELDQKTWQRFAESLKQYIEAERQKSGQ